MHMHTTCTYMHTVVHAFGACAPRRRGRARRGWRLQTLDWRRRNAEDIDGVLYWRKSRAAERAWDNAFLADSDSNPNTTNIPGSSADLAEDPFHDELDESTSESDDDEDFDLEDGRA